MAAANLALPIGIIMWATALILDREVLTVGVTVNGNGTGQRIVISRAVRWLYGQTTILRQLTLQAETGFSARVVSPRIPNVPELMVLSRPGFGCQVTSAHGRHSG